MGPTTLTFTVMAVLAGIVGAGVVWRTPERLGVVGLVSVPLVAALGVGFVAFMALLPGDVDLFGISHLAYLGIVVSVPIVGLAVGTRVVTSELSNVGALAAVVLVLPAGVGWYATHVEPHRLRVERVTAPVADEREGDDPVRIGVMADLQTADPGRYEEEAIDRLLAEEPDLILLPGDIFQGREDAFAAHLDDMRALLGRLHAPHGVYLVRGDSEVADYADRLVAGTDIVLLDDQSVDLTVRDRRLRLGGNRLLVETAAATALRQELAAAPEDGTIRILVAHRPDAALDLTPNSRIDLVVAGHTHGGQIVVPGFGPLVTLTSVPRHIAAGGLHDLSGNQIYVGTGVGLERGQAPQIRLFSRPSIGIITLR
jgi:hypothetical protein